ncbi:MAG: hypothetical protein Q7S27_03560 [Nanoarchaeota archaeon]|nr:hypothetical protein [Nanoarchaeota archaeon]
MNPATISFFNERKDKPTSIIYRHHDGLPRGLGIDLLTFTNEIRYTRTLMLDSHFNDASYLSAKWIVYDAIRQQKHRGEMQRFYRKDRELSEKLNVKSIEDLPETERQECIDEILRYKETGEKITPVHYLEFSSIGIISDIGEFPTENNYQVICNGAPLILYNNLNLIEVLKEEKDYPQCIESRRPKNREEFYYQV